MWLGKRKLKGVIGKKPTDLNFAHFNSHVQDLYFWTLPTLSPREFPSNGKIGEHATSQWKGANKYAQFIIGVLNQAKNGDKQFWKEKFHATNGKAQHGLMDNQVFSFWKGTGGGWGDRDFLFFSLVPNVPPSCSHQVLNVFSKCSLRLSQ
jgi:hypothetical protein